MRQGNIFKILIDTNIFIFAEDYREVSQDLSSLLRILEENSNILYVHPLSVEDLERDECEERRRIMKSKLEKYPRLESPPSPTSEFLEKIGPIKTPNDRVDAHLLYALWKACVDFLLTEDQALKKKAEKVNIREKVITVDSALVMFKELYREPSLPQPTWIEKLKPYSLELTDSFFDSLKRDYPDFPEWWKKISTEGRDCWVYFQNGKRIGALLILKEENEAVSLREKNMPPQKRLKICTLKVKSRGFRLGELFLKMATYYCIKKNIFEIYLTHFQEPNDSLLNLLERFGFREIGETNRKSNDKYEKVYLKELRCPQDPFSLSPVEISRKYWPSFARSERVRKFIVPIKPQFHNRLFPDYPKRGQTSLLDFSREGRILVPGNTIDKVYFSRSKVKTIKPGDILLFYRSRDQKCLTSLAVVHNVLSPTKKVQELVSFAAERTVYSRDEIEKMARKPVLGIQFRFHFFLPKPIPLNELVIQSVIKGSPQSIIKISHSDYMWIEKEGGVYGHFAFD